MKELGCAPSFATLQRRGGGKEGHAITLGWELGQMTSKSFIHIDLHKQNNKLVSA